jgi:hypothetical protein
MSRTADECRARPAGTVKLITNSAFSIVFSIRQLPVYLNWMMANIGGAGESRNRKGAVMVPDYYLSRSCGSMSLY